MANTMDKLRELSAKWRSEADEASERATLISAGNAVSLTRCADELDAILRESEAQGDVAAVDAWERRLRGRAGPFTAQAGERYVEADVALEAFRFALAASATSEPDADLELIWHSVSDNAETNAAYRRLKARLAALNPKKQESECPWGGCGDCVGHEAIQPADGGARVTEAWPGYVRTALRVIEQSSRELAVHARTLRDHIAALAARERGAS